MKIILAHWKKDYLSSRSLVIAWAVCLALILVVLVFRCAAPHLPPSLLPSNSEGFPKILLVVMAGAMGVVGVAGVQFALLTLLIVRIIHLDPLVDPDAWWRTRPISGLSLLAAKSLSVVACLLGAFLTIATIQFGDFSMLSSFLSAIVFVLGMVAFASLTTGLSQLILNWLGLALLASVLGHLIRALGQQTLVNVQGSSFSVDIHGNAAAGTATGSLLITFLYLAGFLVTIFCQYLQPRPLLARAILFATFFLATLLAGI